MYVKNKKYEKELKDSKFNIFYYTPYRNRFLTNQKQKKMATF